MDSLCTSKTLQIIFDAKKGPLQNTINIAKICEQTICVTYGVISLAVLPRDMCPDSPGDSGNKCLGGRETHYICCSFGLVRRPCVSALNRSQQVGQ